MLLKRTNSNDLAKYIPGRAENVENSGKMSLYLLSELFFGIVFLHNEQCGYLYKQVDEIVKQFRKRRPKKEIDLDAAEIYGRNIDLPEVNLSRHLFERFGIDFGSSGEDSSSVLGSFDELDYHTITSGGSAVNGNGKNDGAGTVAVVKRSRNKRMTMFGSPHSPLLIEEARASLPHTARYEDITMNDDGVGRPSELFSTKMDEGEDFGPVPIDWEQQMQEILTQELPAEHVENQPAVVLLTPPFPPTGREDEEANEPIYRQGAAAEEELNTMELPKLDPAEVDRDLQEKRKAGKRRKRRISRVGPLVDEYTYFSKTEVRTQVENYSDTIWNLDNENEYGRVFVAPSAAGGPTLIELFDLPAIGALPNSLLLEQYRQLAEQPSAARYLELYPRDGGREENEQQAVGADEIDQHLGEKVDEVHGSVAAKKSRQVPEKISELRADSSDRDKVSEAVRVEEELSAHAPTVVAGLEEVAAEFVPPHVEEETERQAEAVEEIATKRRPTSFKEYSPVAVHSYDMDKKRLLKDIMKTVSKRGADGRVFFDDMFPAESTSCITAAKSFSLILDLIRNKKVKVEQKERFGPMSIMLYEAQ